MRTSEMGFVTPQRKTIGVNDKFGNRGIKKQQGSTVIKYDTLLLDGSTNLRFFDQSSQRNFPLSNTGTDGNKLGVGNSMVVERAYFTICQRDKTTGALIELAPLAIGVNNFIDSLLNGEFNFEIANATVIKQLPILSFIPEFNKIAENSLNTNYEFDTQIVIPPLLEYVATLRIPNYTPDPEKALYLRLTIEGAGAIIAPKATF
jgi:hypothetical protein